MATHFFFSLMIAFATHTIDNIEDGDWASRQQPPPILPILMRAAMKCLREPQVAYHFSYFDRCARPRRKPKLEMSNSAYYTYSASQHIARAAAKPPQKSACFACFSAIKLTLIATK